MDFSESGDTFHQLQQMLIVELNSEENNFEELLPVIVEFSNVVQGRIECNTTRLCPKLLWLLVTKIQQACNVSQWSFAHATFGMIFKLYTEAHIVDEDIIIGNDLQEAPTTADALMDLVTNLENSILPKTEEHDVTFAILCRDICSFLLVVVDRGESKEVKKDSLAYWIISDDSRRRRFMQAMLKLSSAESYLAGKSKAMSLKSVFMYYLVASGRCAAEVISLLMHTLSDIRVGMRREEELALSTDPNYSEAMGWVVNCILNPSDAMLQINLGEILWRCIRRLDPKVPLPQFLTRLQADWPEAITSLRAVEGSSFDESFRNTIATWNAGVEQNVLSMPQSVFIVAKDIHNVDCDECFRFEGTFELGKYSCVITSVDLSQPTLIELPFWALSDIIYNNDNNRITFVIDSGLITQISADWTGQTREITDSNQPHIVAELKSTHLFIRAHKLLSTKEIKSKGFTKVSYATTKDVLKDVPPSASPSKLFARSAESVRSSLNGSRCVRVSIATTKDCKKNKDETKVSYASTKLIREGKFSPNIDVQEAPDAVTPGEASVPPDQGPAKNREANERESLASAAPPSPTSSVIKSVSGASAKKKNQTDKDSKKWHIRSASHPTTRPLRKNAAVATKHPPKKTDVVSQRASRSSKHKLNDPTSICGVEKKNAKHHSAPKDALTPLGPNENADNRVPCSNTQDNKLECDDNRGNLWGEESKSDSHGETPIVKSRRCDQGTPVICFPSSDKDTHKPPSPSIECTHQCPDTKQTMKGSLNNKSNTSTPPINLSPSMITLEPKMPLLKRRRHSAPNKMNELGRNGKKIDTQFIARNDTCNSNIAPEKNIEHKRETSQIRQESDNSKAKENFAENDIPCLNHIFKDTLSPMPKPSTPCVDLTRSRCNSSSNTSQIGVRKNNCTADRVKRNTAEDTKVCPGYAVGASKRQTRHSSLKETKATRQSANIDVGRNSGKSLFADITGSAEDVLRKPIQMLKNNANSTELHKCVKKGRKRHKCRSTPRSLPTADEINCKHEKIQKTTREETFGERWKDKRKTMSDPATPFTASPPVVLDKLLQCGMDEPNLEIDADGLPETIIGLVNTDHLNMIECDINESTKPIRDERKKRSKKRETNDEQLVMHDESRLPVISPTTQVAPEEVGEGMEEFAEITFGSLCLEDNLSPVTNVKPKMSQTCNKKVQPQEADKAVEQENIVGNLKALCRSIKTLITTQCDKTDSFFRDTLRSINEDYENEKEGMTRAVQNINAENKNELDEAVLKMRKEMDHLLKKMKDIIEALSVQQSQASSVSKVFDTMKSELEKMSKLNNDEFKTFEDEIEREFKSVQNKIISQATEAKKSRGPLEQLSALLSKWETL